ncbi:HEXXH motif-containing putative peptide modification protein [Streptomyces sp. NPDC048606]|uniref:aKG-HExxH-type peptide beta-hydroxylase n=1 Tax=Streptomyces sp. NPDC048606 TaxID=3154726 RepID=UPI003432BC92
MNHRTDPGRATPGRTDPTRIDPTRTARPGDPAVPTPRTPGTDPLGAPPATAAPAAEAADAPDSGLDSFAVSSRTLRALASTEPTPEGTRLVRDVRRSKRLLLLRAVLDAAPDGPGGETGERWALLEEAERQDPDAVRDVLHYPATGVWAEETLRRLHAPYGPAPDLAHLGALAVAAALRAGIGFKATLRPVNGRLVLPTLGLLRPDRPGPLALTERSWDSADALPLHPLPGGRASLDDLDPYRVRPPGGPAPGHPVELRTEPVRAARRLTPKGHKRWDIQWSGALTLLERYDSTRAEEVDALLRSVVPLAGGSRSTGATLPAAAGSLLARSQAPPALAATLVHEVQHGKLAALADILTLHTADRTPCHWAPWREDPRPLEGLLHGTYAHLALAGYWQRAALYGARGAWAQHARLRAQVAAVLPALRAEPHLTVTGREFVEGMACAERAMDELPPPGDQHATARRALDRERRAWYEAHPEIAPPRHG